MWHSANRLCSLSRGEWREKTPVKQVSEPAKAKETPEPTYTKEDVRAVLASKSAAGYKKEVKELLEKYGAQQLKQVNPDDYAALLQEAEVIGNA